MIFGGDFNCILSSRDCSSGNKTLLSKALKTLIHSFSLKDNYDATKGIPEYTYMRKYYGSRTDRIYTKRLFNQIQKVDTVPVSFSDHNLLLVSFKLENIRLGKGYWKLNTELLNVEGIGDDFKMLWYHLKSKKNDFKDILLWWEWVKKECKIFFSKLGKRISQEKFGLLNLL